MPEPHAANQVASTTAHVYHRQLSTSERTSLSAVAASILPGTKVLDLGTGSGALGAYLSQTLHCTVDGVTYNQQEADIAAPGYRRLVVADLDNCALDTLFAGEQYDYIVCADVLEHTKQPRRTLDAARGLLAPLGKLVLSVPNASYCGLVAELMHGEFRYRDEGLLDHTHLRFFTRDSLLRFLGKAGWAVDAIDTIERPLNESEFCDDFDRLPPAVARYLLALPDALSYQFVVTALPAQPADDATAAISVHSGAARAVYSAQLYWGLEGSLAEDRKLVAAGQIGAAQQDLVFQLPITPKAITNLRLDPADRPGFLYLYQMCLRQADGQLLWSWSSEANGIQVLLTGATHQVLPCLDGPVQDATLLALHGDDPWVELPIPAAVLALAAGGELVVTLGWPMSADFVAVERTVDRLLAERESPAPPVAQVASAKMQQARQLKAENLALKAEAQALTKQLERMKGSVAMQLFKPLYQAKYWIGRWVKALLGAQKPAEERKHRVNGASCSEVLVDVIVPVYAGLSDTRRCLESVLGSRCKTPFRLLVINDASPEPELTQWLRQLAARDQRITLLENTDNLGFVATVNRGMQQSGTRDVLLLNSDTEVANDWLDRLRAAAYGDARVASVTPFSNNATICSFPRFCEVNPPPDMGTAAMDALFAQTNLGQVVDVPTGVGFCMYIRRACLDEIGYFDVENFGKGYGEENDFCVRAAQAGWRNLHALDVFVLHAGGVSFGDSKSAREQAAMLTLRRLHPGYEPAVHAFLQLDPARDARQRVEQAQRK